jgi:23S rRNA pseudouridine2605 synthase
MEEVRLQKFMAETGIASRRKCEKYIQNGKVMVNGKIVTELGVKINPKTDEVLFNGKKIKKDKKVYILLNKPIDYVTTVHDQFERKGVLELLKGVDKRVVPVGRLDMYTSRSIVIK